MERRVGELEEADKDRQDSSAGLRRDLAAHQLEDAKAIGEVKGLIAKLEEQIGINNARVKIMTWVFGILAGAASVGSGLILYRLYELASTLRR